MFFYLDSIQTEIPMGFGDEELKTNDCSKLLQKGKHLHLVPSIHQKLEIFPINPSKTWNIFHQSIENLFSINPSKTWNIFRLRLPKTWWPLNHILVRTTNQHQKVNFLNSVLFNFLMYVPNFRTRNMTRTLAFVKALPYFYKPPTRLNLSCNTTEYN